MSHSTESSSQPQPDAGSSQMLFGPFQTQSTLQQKRLLPAREARNVTNIKSRKTKEGENALPVKAKPYYKLSGSDTERETQSTPPVKTRRVAGSKRSNAGSVTPTMDMKAPTAQATNTQAMNTPVPAANTQATSRPVPRPQAASTRATSTPIPRPRPQPANTRATVTDTPPAQVASTHVLPAQSANTRARNAHTPPAQAASTHIPPAQVASAQAPNAQAANIQATNTYIPPAQVAPAQAANMQATNTHIPAQPANPHLPPAHVPTVHVANAQTPTLHYPPAPPQDAEMPLADAAPHHSPITSSNTSGTSQMVHPQLQSTRPSLFSPSHSIPLHLLHHSLLPCDLLPFVQDLYYAEQKQALSDQEVITLWSNLSEDIRRQVVERYLRYVTESQMRASDAAFSRMSTQLIKAPSSSSVASSRSTATARRSSTRQTGRGAEATQAPSTTSYEPNVAKPSASQHSALPVAPALFEVSVSSQGSLDFEAMESNLIDDHAMDEDETSSGRDSSEDEQYDFDEDSGTIKTRDKGKGRAEDPVEEPQGAPSMDYEGDDEGEAQVEDEDEDMDSALPDAGANPMGGHSSSTIDPDLMVLLVHKMDGMSKTVRHQGGCMQQMMDANRAFQEAMLLELRGIREAISQPGNGTSQQALPATPPTTPDKRVAVRKVHERSAKARGREIVLTPAQVDHDHRVRLQNRMHAHMRSLLQIESTSEVAVRHPTLEDAQVEAYMSGAPGTAITVAEFRMDFKRPYKGFPMNMAARRVIMISFQDKAAGGKFVVNPPPAKFLTEEYLGSVIDQYVNTLRRAYREATNPKSREAKDALLAKRAQFSRMDSLYQSRLYVIVHTERYRPHTILFQRMRTTNMSADESDSPDPALPKIWRIILANWQSVELRNFLWALDAKYLAASHKPTDGRRRIPGNKIRVRQVCESSRTTAGVAPPGLWINCYNPTWLQSLPEWEVEQLEIINTPYDFTLDPPEQEAGAGAGPSSS